MANKRPRVFKRSNVKDEQLNRALQQIDDEFTNVYRNLPVSRNIDGGTPDSVYEDDQVIDGGGV